MRQTWLKPQQPKVKKQKPQTQHSTLMYMQSYLARDPTPNCVHCLTHGSCNASPLSSRSCVQFCSRCAAIKTGTCRQGRGACGMRANASVSAPYANARGRGTLTAEERTELAGLYHAIE